MCFVGGWLRQTVHAGRGLQHLLDKSEVFRVLAFKYLPAAAHVSPRQFVRRAVLVTEFKRDLTATKVRPRVADRARAPEGVDERPRGRPKLPARMAFSPSASRSQPAAFHCSFGSGSSLCAATNLSNAPRKSRAVKSRSPSSASALIWAKSCGRSVSTSSPSSAIV
jgi:hypothetical protein